MGDQRLGLFHVAPPIFCIPCALSLERCQVKQRFPTENKSPQCREMCTTFFTRDKTPESVVICDVLQRTIFSFVDGGFSDLCHLSYVFSPSRPLSTSLKSSLFLQSCHKWYFITPVLCLFHSTLQPSPSILIAHDSFLTSSWFSVTLHSHFPICVRLFSLSVLSHFFPFGCMDSCPSCLCVCGTV